MPRIASFASLCLSLTLVAGCEACPSFLDTCSADDDCGAGLVCAKEEDGTGKVGLCTQPAAIVEQQPEAIVSFGVDVVRGNAPLAVRATWEVSGSPHTCRVEGNGSVLAATPKTTGSVPLTLASTTTLQLVCGELASAPIDVVVASVSDISTTPRAVAAPGGEVRVAWSKSPEVGACTFSGAGQEVDDAVPPFTVRVASPEVVLRVACDGIDGGKVEAVLAVPYLDIAPLVVDPARALTPSEPALLSWEATDGAVCALASRDIATTGAFAPLAGDLPSRAEGYVVGALAASTTLELSCALQDARMSRTVDVHLAPVTTSPIAGTLGDAPGEVTLSWGVANAHGCTLLDGDRVLGAATTSGVTVPVGAGRHALRAECTGSDGVTRMRVDGDIVVFGGDIEKANLNDLAGVELVTGQVAIGNASTALGLDSEALREIGADLSIASNRADVGTSLPSLTRIGGALTLVRNDALTAVRLRALAVVGKSVEIKENPCLVALELPALRHVGGAELTVKLNAAEVSDEATALPGQLDTMPASVEIAPNSAICNR